MTATPDTEQLDERARMLLKTLVENYIVDGQPVASRKLSKASGSKFSPATVRNVMADLEELGFIQAPHTSAGRVPTVKGYRCFVDTMVAVKPLSEEQISKLEHELGLEGHQSSKDLAKTASTILSSLTHLAGVVTLPRRTRSRLRQIEFLRLGECRMLAILVFEDQEVQNRIINTQRDLGESELREAANYLTAQLAGSDVEAVREGLINALNQTRDHMNRMMLDAVTLAQQVFSTGSQDAGQFVVAGETNLMDVQELSDVQRLRGLFDAFNEQRDILQLLDQSLTADGVEIFIGEESGHQLFDDVSVVTSPYRVNDEIVGVLGVIGPTRMAYERVIPIVDVTARLIAAALNSKS
ncbi:MAG: heat-inducible transcriptional repressor HrcA [Gammaproteobacteria bacterium]